ncbi:TPA: hypothetical protein QDA71_006466 [Burkholderia vietnamiensis]|nr:hypothetical protein [Burkholderia contaminans]MBR8016131.1 hypothetical protein [Burkholderia vietnamiensis]PRE01348.1 hypothetical protein C6P91_24300 [Burkholderia multivorans]QMI50121.1 hypothetical protein MBR110_31780 [Burkholderia sp. MBR-1]MBR8231804.1 hypothetical protein [Burkholderia vietnamiensis]
MEGAMRSPRFRRAATDARPYGAHRFDVFGPKVGRRLTLFGRRVFQLWLRLESNPQVVTYCERPLLVPEARGTRAADFWVCTDQGEQLHLVLRSSEATLVEQGISLYPALDAWSQAHSMTVRTILPDELDDPEPLCQNRLTMLNYLAANTVPARDEICRAILIACIRGLTLAKLEQRFASIDPVLVRTAAFALLLKGGLDCPTIASRPLGPDSCLETK